MHTFLHLFSTIGLPNSKCEQCVPGSLPSSPTQEPGNEATTTHACTHSTLSHWKGLSEWAMLSSLLYLSTAHCMPSVKLTESVPMYVVIFKGIAPCPQLHTQVIQDKQPTHYKAHMLSGHGVLPRTILLANTTFVDLTIQTSNTTSIRREKCTYSLCFSHSAHGSEN